MYLDRLWLTDFRNYETAEVTLSGDGLTAVVGDNGEGKTNLLEAIAYLATQRSFRGAPAEALVRVGARSAVVRGEGRRAARTVLVEAELHPQGPPRMQVNHQPVRRRAELSEALVATVFTPEDLALVKEGPQHRREFLDDLLVSLHPRHEVARTELDRVLRQRNALLRGAQSERGHGGDPALVATLEVWDAKLAAAGQALVRAREGLTEALQPVVADAYRRLGAFRRSRPAFGPAGSTDPVSLHYQRSWEGDLAEALADARAVDLRRGVTTIGPQRDELVLRIEGLPARLYGSQGEQRSLALALRLAGHHVVTERLGSSPILLLDDVFSELDPDRSRALLGCLPVAQAVVSTAGALPGGMEPSATLRVEGGKIVS